MHVFEFNVVVARSCFEYDGVGLDGCAGVAQLVELQFSKLNVASSSLVARSKQLSFKYVSM